MADVFQIAESRLWAELQKSPDHQDEVRVKLLKAFLKSAGARTPLLMLPSWMPGWTQRLFTLFMPTVPAPIHPRTQALFQRIDKHLQHSVISPDARKLVEKSSFVIVVDTGPGSKGRQTAERTKPGMGFFYGSHTALCCAHNLPGYLLQKGKVVQAMDRGAQSSDNVSKISLTVADFDTQLDWVRLTTESKHTFVPIYQGPMEDLLGASLALCSFHTSLSAEAQEALPRMAVMPVVGILLSQNSRHLLYSCPSLGGNYGSAVLLYKGQVAAMHRVGVDAASEQMEQRATETDAETTLDEAAASLSSISESAFQGALALTSLHFPEV